MGSDKTFTIDGLRLEYRVDGNSDSPPMVLLHALGQNSSDWQPVSHIFAREFQVFGLDLRGHGSSDRPGIYSFDAMCEDVLGMVSHLGLNRFTLIGHSMGGVVAYMLAIRHPELVSHLIIEDVAPPFKRERPIPDPPENADSLGFDWKVVPAIVAEVNAGSPSTWAGLKDIAAPALIIGGGPSSHIPQDKLSKAAGLIPECKLITLATGHNVHATKPAAFAQAVLSWHP